MPQFQMEEEEHTDRKQQLAMLYQKLTKIKEYLNEGNGPAVLSLYNRYTSASTCPLNHHDTLLLLQMTQTILIRLLAQTHRNHASRI